MLDEIFEIFEIFQLALLLFNFYSKSSAAFGQFWEQKQSSMKNNKKKNIEHGDCFFPIFDEKAVLLFHNF